MVRAPGEGGRYNVEPPFPVREVEVKLCELLLPPVVAGAHVLEFEWEKEWSVVGTDGDRAA